MFTHIQYDVYRDINQAEYMLLLQSKSMEIYVVVVYIYKNVNVFCINR